MYEPFFSSISTSVTSHPNCGLTPLSYSQTWSGLMSESYWFSGVRMTPSKVSILQNSCMNLCMYRLSSKAEFQTWNPNVVCHMSQKLVLKKSGVNQSVILVPWSSVSDAKVSLSSCMRWLWLKPMDFTSSLIWCLSTSLELACVGFLASNSRNS